MAFLKKIIIKNKVNQVMIFENMLLIHIVELYCHSISLYVEK